MSQFPKWRMTQSAMLKLVVAFIFVLISCYVSRAQDLEQDAANQGDAEVVAGVRPTSQSIMTALRTIEGQNPQSPTELLHAADVLRLLGAFEEAKSYVDRSASAASDDASLAKIHADLGTVELLRLANDQAMVPEGRDFVFKVFAAARKQRRSPARIRASIAQLASTDDETRRVAMKRLSEAGGYAVPPLLDAFRNSVDGVSVSQLNQAMANLGSSAEDALIAAVGAPNPYIQAIAAGALRTAGSARARQHLIRPYFSDQPIVAERAKKALQKLAGKYPSSASQSASYLNRLAKRHLAGQPPVRPDYDGTLEMWTWNAGDNNVVPHRLSTKEAAAVTAARLARDAYELSPTAENQQLLLVSQLQAEQMLVGLDNELRKGVGTPYEFAQSVGALGISAALRTSLDESYDAAAIGACELLGDLSESGVSANHLTPLVRALQSPNRRVRFSAAQAIMKIDPKHAYTGASYMLEALTDLADAQGQRRAIVATPRTEIRNRVAGMLGGIGFAVHQANEGNACLKEALRSSDYDVIVLSDSTSRPTASETIQQLRKQPRGRRIPIILLAREDLVNQTEQLANQDDLVVTMPEFGDEESLAERLEELEQLVDNDFTPADRRLEQAKDALDWLVHISKYSRTYHWYDYMRARDVAIKATGNPVLGGAAIALLGYQGDELAQKMLVQTASRKGETQESRQRAANAFGEAVLRRGLMLRKADVYAQYDRYNASENEDKQTQEILGQILDIIETQTYPQPVSTTTTVF